MAYSDTGMGKMSRDLLHLMRERVIAKRWRYKVPPVLLNTWEAVYFQFDHDIIVSIVEAAARGDIEMIVLDDGWFGKRDNVSSGLGDRKPNRAKLLHGVDGLATAINELGLRFGIWIEPEVVSMDSELFLRNPNWCLRVPNRGLPIGRQQHVLDFSRQAVVDHIYGQLVELLSSAED